MESRKGGRKHTNIKTKLEEHETQKSSKTNVNSNHHHEKTEELNAPEARTLKEKLHTTSHLKTQNQSLTTGLDGYYKRSNNKKAFKCNWTNEEDELLTKLCKDQPRSKNWKRISERFPGKTDIQCMQRWEKFLNPESTKGKKRPWTEEEDLLVLKLVEKNGPQKWTFIADHLPGRIGKQCRERWHNHLNPRIKKSSWSDDEEWLLFLHHKAAGNKWADIAKSLPGRTDNSIKNHWNSSMKKRIPELLNRFLKLKEAGGLQYLETMTGISKIERELLDSLFKMGDNDFHSIHGITHAPGDDDEPPQGNKEDTKKHTELKATKTSTDTLGRSRNSSSNRSDFASMKSPRDSATMKKFMEEVQFNPKTCEEIRNYIKENNLDIPSITSLDLKNPEHMKLLDQLYNPKVLKSILVKGNHAIQKQEGSKKLQEDGHANNDCHGASCRSGGKEDDSRNELKEMHSNTNSGNSSHNRNYTCKNSHDCCTKGCKKSSRHHERSSNRHYSNEGNMYYPSEKQAPTHTNSRSDYYKFTNPQSNLLNSPLISKDVAYRFSSPNHIDNPIKKENGYSGFRNSDMMEKEDDIFARGNSEFNCNPDSYLFGSPMPLKKVKLEEPDHSPLDFIKQEDSNPEGKSKNFDDRLHLGWIGENQDPNMGHSNNSSLSAKKNIHSFLNNSASKDRFNASASFFSPKPNKYESPSRLIAFSTPDCLENHIALPNDKKFPAAGLSEKSPSLFVTKPFIPYDKTSMLEL